jgi:hypothetical protein
MVLKDAKGVIIESVKVTSCKLISQQSGWDRRNVLLAWQRHGARLATAEFRNPNGWCSINAVFEPDGRFRWANIK